MRANVLIQTVITFEILKSYRDFCICVPIKDYTFPLCKLELSTKSQIIKASKSRAFSAFVRMAIGRAHMTIDFAFQVK